MEEKPLTDWNSGFCDCFEDASTCCYGFWCSICLAGTVSRQFGENNCLPLCDLCASYYGSIPPGALSLRAAMRHKYGIKGSLCKDIFISWCCTTLSWCQMYRELKHCKKNPVSNCHQHAACSSDDDAFSRQLCKPPSSRPGFTLI
ncbi:hypothetical protein ATANTOWER_027685 [Ataeniobius toweri]|uniref:Uncharacterized protein n=1 Tax=Ataeniobius toweri TaxID=208326 RepID=A0ABU7A949_9TELE|nr:hypothetical protein [Ataeniobius toweri]